MCCFCREVDRVETLVAAGTFHAKKKSTDEPCNRTYEDFATVLENDGLLQDLSRGDIASNEMFYRS